MATITWTNTTADGNMDTANNWDLSRIPASGDSAFIPTGNGQVLSGSLHCDAVNISVYILGGDFYCPANIDMQAGNTYIKGGTFHEIVTVLNVADRGITDGTFLKGIVFPSSTVYGSKNG